ncbi:MAG TPA: energy transducer TonB [Syntrophorhabdaceae bacterium]|jgi:protein TonB|nr:energy transducer TonB [Syntrophorhabdaceae bacterium]
MKDSLRWMTISFLLHAFIIIPLAFASFNQNGKTKFHTIEVDFSIIKDIQGERPTQTFMTKTIPSSKRIGASGRASGKPSGKPYENSVKTENIPEKEQIKPNAEKTIVSASDVRGEMVVHGTPATYAGSSGSSMLLLQHGGAKDGIGGGDGRGGGGDGNGTGEGGVDYSYIRNAIMKNIKYPDRARRLGFEGQVVLSFTVLEDGTVSDVRVVNSSGHKILDEGAKDAATEARINRKMSHRVAVRLPVTYRLQH